MINSAIYNGQVIHKRFKPKVHYFKYKVFSLLLDLSELEILDKKVWCSWNSSLNPDNKEQSSVTYWLNQLQNLKIDKNIFLTINPFFKIDHHKIFNEIDFTHPYYDENALQNQSNLKSIQNVNNTLFAGSYFGYGFHEDGIKSSIEMLKTLND